MLKESLYQIESSILAILDSCDGGELSQEQADALDTLEMDRIEKLHNYCKVIEKLQRENEAAQAKIRQIGDNIIKPNLDRIEFLQKRMFESMKQFGDSKLALGEYRVSIKKNPPKLQLPEDFDISLLTSEFIRVKPEERSVDKQSLMQSYRNGKALPECVQVVQDERLEIK